MNQTADYKTDFIIKRLTVLKKKSYSVSNHELFLMEVEATADAEMEMKLTVPSTT
jgi:hypothetical protein